MDYNINDKTCTNTTHATTCTPACRSTTSRNPSRTATCIATTCHNTTTVGSDTLHHDLDVTNDNALVNPSGPGVFDQCTREPAVLIKTKHQPLRISTFNTRTLKDNWRLSELIYNARNQDLSIVGIQEHRRVHEEELNQNEGYHFNTGSAWRNSSQAAVGGVGILLKNSAERAMSTITSL